MSLPKVLLTRKWPSSVESAMAELFDLTLNLTDQAFSIEQLQMAFSEYDAVCPCVTDSISAEVLAVPEMRAKILANYGVGYNHIDTASAKANGLVVTNTPDVLTHATADLAMTLMLMVARRASEGEKQIQQRNWQGWFPTHLMGATVTGKTLGIVGMGSIGRAMAYKAHHGFNMNILYHNRKPVDDLTEIQAQFCEELIDLLNKSDFVAIHCPSTPATHHMMNAETLGQMKPEAFLINTSRGDVVDESALIKALQNATIAGAGLDVFENEPSIPSELLVMDNVTLLPHLGSATQEAREAMGMKVLENLKAFFGGNLPPNQVI